MQNKSSAGKAIMNTKNLKNTSKKVIIMDHTAEY